MRSALFAVLFALTAHAQSLELRRARPAAMPSRADCNSPVWWRDGKLLVLTPTGDPKLNQGPDQFSLTAAGPVRIAPPRLLPIWFESVWQDADGRLYT